MFTKKVENNKIKYFSEKIIDAKLKFIIILMTSIILFEPIGGFLSKKLEKIFSFLGTTGLIIGGVLGILAFFVGIYLGLLLLKKIINIKEDFTLIENEGILINEKLINFKEIEDICKITQNETYAKNVHYKTHYIEIKTNKTEYNIVYSKNEKLVDSYVKELNSYRINKFN